MKRRSTILTALAAGISLAPIATVSVAHAANQPSPAEMRASFMTLFPAVVRAMRPCIVAKTAMDKDVPAGAHGDRSRQRLQRDAMRTMVTCTQASNSLKTITIPASLQNAPHVRLFVQDAQRYAAAAADLGTVIERALQGDPPRGLYQRINADLAKIAAAGTDLDHQLRVIAHAWFS